MSDVARARARRRPWSAWWAAFVVVPALVAAAGCGAHSGALSADRRGAVVTTKVTPDPAHVGLPMSVAITLAPAEAGGPVPTGQVELAGAKAPVPLVDGAATVSVNPTAIGKGSIDLSYAGDQTYAPTKVEVKTNVEKGLTPFTGKGPTVAMVGDSITFWSKPAIDRHLDGFRHSVTAVSGYETVSAKWAMDAYAPLTPDVMVMDLGTNDNGRITKGMEGYTIPEYKARVTAFAAKFQRSCFVVTTITSHITTGTPKFEQYNAQAREINAWLHATFPHVIEWDDAVAAGMAKGAPILTDEVHANAAGHEVLGQLVADAARECTKGR